MEPSHKERKGKWLGYSGTPQETTLLKDTPIQPLVVTVGQLPSMNVSCMWHGCNELQTVNRIMKNSFHMFLFQLEKFLSDRNVKLISVSPKDLTLKLKLVGTL